MVLPQPSQAFFWTQEPWGAALKSAALAEVAPHLFTSSAVSVSRDPSDPQLAAVAASLGLTPDAIVQAHQVHGRDVLVVRADRPLSWKKGTVPFDAFVSDDPRRAVGVRVADCAPILMADTRTGVVAAVHAGWRGTAAGVVGAAVDSMSAEFGSHPRDLIVAIGPSIRACCYEVGPELLAAFADAGHDRAAIDRWFTKGTGDRWQLDVVRANRDQLEAAGVPAAQIYDSGLCTLCQADAASSPDTSRVSNTLPAGHPRGETIALHSYRRDGARAGRMLGVIRTRS
jgi:YfiH family protein